MQQCTRYGWFLLLSSVCGSSPTWADTPQQMLDGYNAQAQAESVDFQGFDVQRGAQFFNNTHANDWSCATCHTSNPAAMGKHDKTAKSIEPLAPSANAERFTNPKKVEKWFKRNCNDVLERTCTSLEKGDVLTYLLSIE